MIRNKTNQPQTQEDEAIERNENMKLLNKTLIRLKNEPNTLEQQRPTPRNYTRKSMSKLTNYSLLNDRTNKGPRQNGI